MLTLKQNQQSRQVLIVFFSSLCSFPRLCFLPHSILLSLLFSAFFPGGARPHEKEMQVPWDLGELPAENLLAGHSRVPGGGFNPQRTLPHRHAYQGSQPEHWTAGPLPSQQPSSPSSAQSPSPSAATQHQRTSLLWKVTRFLRARPGLGFSGHTGPDLQQDQPGHGQLWESVLRQGPQHSAADAKRTLQLQVSLVLLRGLWRVPDNRVGQRL